MNEKTHDEHSSKFLAALTDRELIGMMLRSVQELRRTNDMGQGAINESFRLLNIAEKFQARGWPESDVSTTTPISPRSEMIAAKPQQDPTPVIKRPLAMYGTATDYEEMQGRLVALAKVATTDRMRRSLLRLAEHCEIESRLVEQTRNCVSESRELLARVDSLLSARVAPQKEERNSHGDILRDAMARVFDRWIDQKASPLPRSVALH